MSKSAPLSLLHDSLVFKVLAHPNQEFISKLFPRPTQEILSDVQAVQARKDCLSELWKKICSGETDQFKLYIELIWQVKIIDLASSYPELCLTSTEILDMGKKLKSEWIGKDGILLKGSRGGSSKVKQQVTKNDKRQNVIRKAFKVRGERVEFHVGRVFLLAKGLFPTDVGQHVSHLCECWACFEHTVWECDYVNTKTRKCHDKGESSCKCGQTIKCIFPAPHPLWTCQPSVTSPPRKKMKSLYCTIISPNK